MMKKLQGYKTYIVIALMALVVGLESAGVTVPGPAIALLGFAGAGTMVAKFERLFGKK